MSLQLAEQFEANEQYEQAYEEYKKLYAATPDDIGLLERLGHISLILEKQDEAASYYYEILKRDVTNALAYDQLISIYENTDRYKYYIYRGNKNSIEGKLDFAINDFKKDSCFFTCFFDELNLVFYPIRFKPKIAENHSVINRHLFVNDSLHLVLTTH